MTKCLQNNVDSSRTALDLALTTANNMGVGLLLVSEPNINTIKNRKDWLFDHNLSTVIKVLNKNIPLLD